MCMYIYIYYRIYNHTYYLPVHIQSTCIWYTSNIHQYNSGGNTQSCWKKILHQQAWPVNHLRRVNEPTGLAWLVMQMHHSWCFMILQHGCWKQKMPVFHGNKLMIDDVCWCLVMFDDVWWCLMLPQLSHCPTTEWTNNGNNHGSTILKYTDYNL